MLPLLIDKATVEKFLQVAIGYSTAEFDRFIREAQEFDLKPLVCEDFYYDLVKNGVMDPHKVLTGLEYIHDDKTYYHDGLEAVLSYFTYARFVLKSGAVSTSHGIVQKTTPNSQPLSHSEKKDMYHTLRQDANTLFTGIVKYMDRKEINYKDCSAGCGETIHQDIVIRAPRW